VGNHWDGGLTSLAPVPGSAAPKPKTAVVERRKAFPRPLVSSVSEATLRHNYKGAPFGAPPPLMFRGVERFKAQLAHIARGNAEAWLFEIRIGNLA
jgi:hypothetical protein